MIAIRERGEVLRAWGQDECVLPAAEAYHWPGFEAPGPVFRQDSPLAALPDGLLARRFHGWRGLSGRRYVCTIFAVPEEALEFADAVVIAVARDASGLRRAVAVTQTGDLAEVADFSLLVAAACAQEACEWHVHLMAQSVCARRAMLDDLQLVPEAL